MRKAISLILAFSVINISCATISSKHAKDYSKQKGAYFVIEKRDGQSVKGELIAVKKTSLLLLDRDSGADMTVDFRDIRIVKIVKKSKFWKGAGLGLLGGGGIGAGIGYASGDAEPTSPSWTSWITAEEKAIISGFLLGVFGAVIGGIASASAGTAETIQFEGKSEAEILRILEKLQKKARVKKAQ